MIGAAAPCEFINRQRQGAALRPFLQGGFRVTRGFLAGINIIPPKIQYHWAAFIYSTIKIKGTDDGFESISQHIVIVGTPRKPFGFGKIHAIAKINRAGDIGDQAALHQGRMSFCKTALAFGWEKIKQAFCNHKAKDPVAQKFKPFIIFTGIQARMSEGRAQSIRILEFISQFPGNIIGGIRHGFIVPCWPDRFYQTGDRNGCSTAISRLR